MGCSLAIVDCHHHLWDLSEHYYPWLTDRITMRVCGEYSAIRKNYLLSDFRRDAEGLDLIKSVHVQAEYDHSDPVRETRWLQSIADSDCSAGFPHAIVAYADFMRDDVADVLDAHCRFQNVRGIRQMLHESHVDPSRHTASLLDNSKWRRNFSLIERFPLSFDLQIYSSQAKAACLLVKEHPNINFVLCHMLQPANRTAEGFNAWRKALKQFAELPNTVIKISGVGMFDRNWTIETLRPIVLTVIEAFGADRCMFGSNFPVDGMMSSYARLWSAFAAVVSDFPISEQQQMFSGNAMKVYRI